jgi:hypothetical protein
VGLGKLPPSRREKQFADERRKNGAGIPWRRVGSLPLVILYAFFVEHYVSAMTGAVKE